MLVDVDEDVDAWTARCTSAQHFQLQHAQFAVGDDEEVAAAAGGVEKGQRAQLLVELEQLVAVALRPCSNSAHSSSRNRGLISLRMFSSLV